MPLHVGIDMHVSLSWNGFGQGDIVIYGSGRGAPFMDSQAEARHKQGTQRCCDASSSFL